MPAFAWTLPGTAQAEWKVTVVRREPAARPDSVAEPPVDGLPLAELDEPSLVAACLAGRPGAFDLIVERHQRPVYRLCYRFTGNQEDARDLSQDVFLRAFRGLRTFRGQSSLATWLYRIGVNVCLNRASTRTVHAQAGGPVDEARQIDAAAESASDRLLRRERATRVRSAIARLPEKQRATLILRTYHDLSHQEIADILGSSVGAVKANFFHALSNLKKLLGDAEAL